jgi:hypothetical protein
MTQLNDAPIMKMQGISNERRTSSEQKTETSEGRVRVEKTVLTSSKYIEDIGRKPFVASVTSCVKRYCVLKIEVVQEAGALTRRLVLCETT